MKLNIEKVRKYCLEKKGTEECFPFDEDTLVFKVLGKIFLICPLERIPSQINIKAGPEDIIEMRESYEDVLPVYHMNKKHWNTVLLTGSIPDKELIVWIDNSYMLVVKGLKKSLRKQLGF